MVASSPSVDVHDPADADSIRYPEGFTDWHLPEDVSAIEQSPSPSACPAPALERQAVPKARIPLTPREIAAHLLGASAHGIAVHGHLELRQITGEIVRRWVVIDRRDGGVTQCESAGAVVRAVTVLS